MAHFAAAVVVSGMASAAGATGVVAAAGFDRRGRARGPGGGEAGGPPGVKPPVKLRCARARPSTLMSVVCNVSIFPRSRRESAPSLRARRISCHCRLLSDANRPAGVALATRGFSASGMAT